ncbi:MAG: NAD(P)/FAD-dependent oxidoreductase [Pseudomonadota bacterium]
MDRRTFTRLGAAFIATSPAILRAQKPKRVIVIGAGAAGMTAAYHLKNAGVDAQIFEASNRMGGRVKRTKALSNVPLDLGAEWIHTDPTVLGEILGQGATSLGVKTIAYAPQTFQVWNNGRLQNFNALRHFYEEVKFFDTTWYGFFERLVMPQIKNDTRLNSPVSFVEAHSGGVSIKLKDGQVHEADKAIVTVPLSALQQGQIKFSPGMKNANLRALKRVPFGSGFKVFLTFKERFYPDILTEGTRRDAMQDAWSSKLYYDAAFGKPTRDNILGLFTVSEGPLLRAGMNKAALTRSILAELSDVFGNVVADSFIESVVQNWSQEPFVNGSYSMSDASNQHLSDLLRPIEGRIFFAGELLGGDNRSTVHGAAFSAMKAVAESLEA